jgi:hypothetical protein
MAAVARASVMATTVGADVTSTVIGDVVTGRAAVVIVGISTDAEAPEVADVGVATAGLQRLALGLREGGDEGVEAEEAAGDLDHLPALGQLFGAADRRLAFGEALPPFAAVAEVVARHPIAQPREAVQGWVSKGFSGRWL